MKNKKTSLFSKKANFRARLICMTIVILFSWAMLFYVYNRFSSSMNRLKDRPVAEFFKICADRAKAENKTAIIGETNNCQKSQC